MKCCNVITGARIDRHPLTAPVGIVSVLFSSHTSDQFYNILLCDVRETFKCRSAIVAWFICYTIVQLLFIRRMLSRKKSQQYFAILFSLVHFGNGFSLISPIMLYTLKEFLAVAFTFLDGGTTSTWYLHGTACTKYLLYIFNASVSVYI